MTCFSLSQLKMLSMVLELMLSLLADSDVSLANIFPIDYFQMYAYVHYKGLRWDFLRPKELTHKVNAPKSVDAVAAALCPSISELRGRQSQCQIAPRLTVHLI